MLGVVNWNVQWATAKSVRLPEILRRINAHTPEIVCLTEADTGLLSESGHVIYSRPDGVYAVKRRRKVLLWSREPWDQVDDLGIGSMPPGRFVSGLTKTSMGEVAVIGVCIPWHGSRTRYSDDGLKRKAWEDHMQFLALLPELLERMRHRRLIVMGDFNQQVGQSGYAPGHVRDALKSAMPPWLTIATSALGITGRRAIDHIALGEDLAAMSLGAISNMHENRKLSDHFGVFAEVSARESR